LEEKCVSTHVTLYDETKRCISAAATSRLHQKFGVIDASVATSDILTWHQMWCSQINFWCLMFWMQQSLVLKKVSQYHSTDNFWQQVSRK